MENAWYDFNSTVVADLLKNLTNCTSEVTNVGPGGAKRGVQGGSNLLSFSTAARQQR